MRVWTFKDKDGFIIYEVNEVPFDYELHEFMVVLSGGRRINTITPNDLRDQQRIIKALDAGECVEGWDDGRGGTVHLSEFCFT
jgi:hypothetical protein